ncbi:MAG: hypothetical protein AAGI03_01040 [Pseudomonadota bacterium]
MMSFSQYQIDGFENARLHEAVRHTAGCLQRDGVAFHNDAQLYDIARFCEAHEVFRSANVHRITEAHLALGMVSPPEGCARPLMRSGFHEDERVRAYVYALTHKHRVVLSPLKDAQ